MPRLFSKSSPVKSQQISLRRRRVSGVSGHRAQRHPCIFSSSRNRKFVSLADLSKDDEAIMGPDCVIAASENRAPRFGGGLPIDRELRQDGGPKEVRTCTVSLDRRKETRVLGRKRLGFAHLIFKTDTGARAVLDRLAYHERGLIFGVFRQGGIEVNVLSLRVL